MARATTGELVAGRYRLVQRLGRGGMGTVDLAHDERLDRPVALKRMHAGASEEVVRRFEREARLGAALDHPNLVAVYDVVRADDAVAIAMEYVDGQSVAEALEHQRFFDDEVVAIVRDIASALDHAHARGVVHRDVKPSNVLLGPYGAKLADLGISTAADATRITTAGSVLGTAAYMAPEQLSGDVVGPEADIYALGLVAYELLAGRPARSGGTPLQLAHRVVSEPPPDVREVRPDLPPGAAHALQRALAVDPFDRQRTASRLASDLERALCRRPSGAAIVPAQATTSQIRGGSAWRWGGRILAVATLVLVAVVALAVLRPGNGGDPRGRGDAAPPTSATGDERAAASPSAATTSAGEGQSEGEGSATATGAEPAVEAGSEPEPEAAAPPVESDPPRPETTSDPPAQTVTPPPETTSDPPAQTEAAPPDAATAPAAAVTPGPAETVRLFYERGAADDYGGAWALLAPEGQAIFGSQQALANTLATLESVSFSRLEPSETGDRASVAFADRATHTGADPHAVDCQGTIGLERLAGSWRIATLEVGCQRVS